MTQKQLYYGAAYYPEWVDRSVWEQDLAYMKEAGLNVVRIGEFAWADMEPRQDAIDLTLFREAVDFYHANGMKVIMCTPTATPPIWMTHGHPERAFREADGVPMSHGSRQHICTNNAFFRERARIIAEAMAQAFGGHPAVIAWQIDNELRAHVADCFCDTCRTLWREWLERRYDGDIRRLNEAWGTGVWSHRYSRFEEVPQPVKTPYAHSTSLQTAYRLFNRETVTAFAAEQAAAIRRHSDAPITHNTGLTHYIDNAAVYEQLDFAGFDQYGDHTKHERMMMAYDIFRPMKAGRPFWVMETAPSHSANVYGYHRLLPEGYMTALAVAAYAAGAEGFMYWVWRQPRSGIEQPHGSAISAWGAPTVGYRPVAEAGKAKAALERLLLASSPERPEVAITYSDRARAYMLTEPTEGLDYEASVGRIYSAAADAGIHRDLPPEDAPLDGYKVLVSPFMLHLSDAYIDRAEAFVRGGGTWIVGPLSGIRTAEHTVHADRALGRLERLAGAETVFHVPMTGSGAVGRAFGAAAPLSLWSATLEPREAQAVGTIEGGPADGLAFVTERRIGAGKLVLLGSMPDGDEGAELLRRLLRHYAEAAGAGGRMDVTPGTMVFPRRDDRGGRLWIVVNVDGEGGAVTLPAVGEDALTGERLAADKLRLEPYAHRVVRFARDEREQRTEA